MCCASIFPVLFTIPKCVSALECWCSASQELRKVSEHEHVAGRAAPWLTLTRGTGGLEQGAPTALTHSLHYSTPHQLRCHHSRIRYGQARLHDIRLQIYHVVVSRKNLESMSGSIFILGGCQMNMSQFMIAALKILMLFGIYLYKRKNY